MTLCSNMSVRGSDIASTFKVGSYLFIYLFILQPRTFLHCFWREKKKERQRNIDVRKKHQFFVFSHSHHPGIKSTTWVCALSGNWTCNPSAFGARLQPTEPCQSWQEVFLFCFLISAGGTYLIWPRFRSLPRNCQQKTLCPYHFLNNFITWLH